jgi:MFS family permease
LSTILGPMAGGAIYGLSGSPLPVYCTAGVFYLLSQLLMTAIRVDQSTQVRRAGSPIRILEGFHYIWANKLVLGSISLDLFAVLLGGAVALLPVYAREILHAGTYGLGMLRGAPGFGAVSMAILLANRPLRRRAGVTMLLCVSGFGIFTIVFGLSRSLPLSLVALVLVGACDMVSVIVRQTLVQLSTPDEMRGRVSAVNMLFIGTSNEIGQFESGLTAQWFGTVPAVVLGGVGTIVVVLLWAWLFPALRRVDALNRR